MNFLSALKDIGDRLNLVIAELEARVPPQSGSSGRNPVFFRDNGTHLSDEGLKELRRLFGLGISIQEAAKQISISEQSVWRYYKKFTGAPTPKG